MAVKILTVRDGKFTEYMKRPLISGDVGAYKIVLQTDYDLANHNVRITAKRSDGVILEDVGAVSGKNAVYTLKSSIYSVAGEVEVRMIVGDSGGNCLTEKALIFDVIASHESGDMEKATDNGKSAADLALAHIYNMQDPHNTRELLGFNKVLSDIEGKLDFELVYGALPELSNADMGKVYLLFEKNDDWSIDNSDAIRYDMYIKTEGDTGVYVWTKFLGNASAEEHTHISADITDVDTVPTSGSKKLVTSDGVHEMGTERVRRKKLNVTKKDYTEFVIPLCCLDNTNNQADSYFSGNIFLKRNNGIFGMIRSIDIVCTKTYNSTIPYFTMMQNVRDEKITLQPVTFTYNSKPYFGLHFSTVVSNFSFGYASGEASDWNIIDCVEVYNNNTKEVINTEIYESIAVADESNQLPVEFYKTPCVRPNGGSDVYRLLTENDVDTAPTEGSNNIITSGAVYDIKPHDASSIPYETGRMWIDEQPVYRVDFSALVYYGCTTWDNGYIVLGDILKNADINTVIDCKVVQCPAKVSHEGEFDGDGLYTSPVEFNGGGIFFDTDYEEGDYDGVIISGYVEYVKSAIDYDSFQVFE